MRTFRTSALCPKCGAELFTSDIASYPFVCLNCDENFYSIEVKNSSNQDYELEMSIPIVMENAERAIEKANQWFSDSDFIGYDEERNILDIGYINMPKRNSLYRAIRMVRKISKEDSYL